MLKVMIEIEIKITIEIEIEIVHCIEVKVIWSEGKLMATQDFLSTAAIKNVLKIKVI
jgi:hypothetical protein